MGDQKSGMLRKFLSYYKPQLHLFWMDTFAAIIVAAVDLAFPQILRHLTGGLFTQGADVIRSVIVYLGIGLFAMTTFFSLVTLPVEINASQRAVAWLERAGIVDAATRPMAVDALKWAAYTYIIGALGSLATLFYYISIANSRR